LSGAEILRMDSSSIVGIVAGGLFVSALGGVAEYVREKEIPSPKGLVRDFLIGAILVVFLLQIMPDSVTTLFAFLPSLKTLQNAVPSVDLGGGDAGPDLQLGPARF